MDVLNARLTDDFKISRSPMCTGRRKSIWSMDAVTTWLCECLCAASAPAISMRCMSLPPNRLPSGLASLGSTTSAICDCDSLTARGGTIWIGVSRPSFEFIVSFSHEGLEDQAMRPLITMRSSVAVAQDIRQGSIQPGGKGKHLAKELSTSAWCNQIPGVRTLPAHDGAHSRNAAQSWIPHPWPP